MLRALALLFFVAMPPLAAIAVECPHAIVVISCKAVVTGEPDQNGFVPREWVIKDGQMVCNRLEVQLADAAEVQGAQPLNHNLSMRDQCQAAAMQIAPTYHHGDYYFFMAGCPTPIVNVDPVTGEETIVGYQMPPCPSWLRCEQDSAI